MNHVGLPLNYNRHAYIEGGGPRVVVSTAAFHARVRGSVPGLGGLKETKMFLPHPRVKVSIVGSLRDREVACSASDRQGSNFESCVWRTVSSQSSHHPQEVLLAQFSLYVHKGGLKPDSFHFILFLAVAGFFIHKENVQFYGGSWRSCAAGIPLIWYTFRLLSKCQEQTGTKHPLPLQQCIYFGQPCHILSTVRDIKVQKTIPWDYLYSHQQKNPLYFDITLW